MGNLLEVRWIAAVPTFTCYQLPNFILLIQR
jgi:hypothetical protein